jgi:hypothetical protein
VAGDEQHQDSWPQDSFRETVGAAKRFDLSTQPGIVRVRRRIPLTSDPARVVTMDAEAPPPPVTVAEGSSADLFRLRSGGFGIPVEVHLRRDLAPSAAQVDDVLAWLGKRRLGGTPRPEPAPVPLAPAPLVPAPPPPLPPIPFVLHPMFPAEAPKSSFWPLLALSLGLAAAMIAIIML